MKKFLHLLLSGLFCAGTVVAQSGPTGPLTWEISGDVLTISGNGAMPNYDFTNDRPPWYEYKSSLSSVIINDGVTGIGSNAFYGSSIYSVTISGSSLKTIGLSAFQSCTNLTSIDIPDEVTQISGYVFYDCRKLSSVTIGKGVASIGLYVFSGCISLPAIDVAAGNNSFVSDDGVLFSMDKKSLRQYPAAKQGDSYSIPDGVTTIFPDAFDSCSKLSSITIPNSVTYIGDWAFVECTGLNSIIIPNGVTQITDYVFSNCTNLTSITIPASLKNIGKGAFLDCKSLSEFVNFSTVPQLLSNAFKGSSINDCTLRVPAASIKEYEKAAEWMEFKNIVALETGLTLELDKEKIFLLIDATEEITATVEYLTFMNVVWKSSQPEVATVNNSGMITAISPGITEISATVLGLEAVCTVTVIQSGKSTIEGIINNAETENVRVNLFIKVEEPGQTKKGIIGGYVLLATTVPNGNGEYRFEDLPEGSYQVQVEIDEYNPEATDELMLSDDDTLMDINFTIDPVTGKIIVDGEDVPTVTEQLFAPELKVYPNPFTDMVRITGSLVEMWRAASLRLQVINTAGTIVHIQTIASPDETIYLGHLPAGMYIIRLENGGMVKTVKVIKIQ